MHRKFEIFPEMKLCTVQPRSQLLHSSICERNYIFPRSYWATVPPYINIFLYGMLECRTVRHPVFYLQFQEAINVFVLCCGSGSESGQIPNFFGQVRSRSGMIVPDPGSELFDKEICIIFEKIPKVFVQSHYAQNLPIIFRGPDLKVRVRIWNDAKTRIRTKNHSGSTTLTFYIINTISTLSGRSLEDIYCKVSGPESG